MSGPDIRVEKEMKLCRRPFILRIGGIEILCVEDDMWGRTLTSEGVVGG